MNSRVISCVYKTMIPLAMERRRRGLRVFAHALLRGATRFWIGRRRGIDVTHAYSMALAHGTSPGRNLQNGSDGQTAARESCPARWRCRRYSGVALGRRLAQRALPRHRIPGGGISCHLTNRFPRSRPPPKRPCGNASRHPSGGARVVLEPLHRRFAVGATARGGRAIACRRSGRAWARQRRCALMGQRPLARARAWGA